MHKTITRITGSKMISDFVEKFGDDVLPKRGQDGKVIVPDLNSDDYWARDITNKYALPEGTAEIVRVDHDDREHCQHCGGGCYTVQMVAADGTCVLTYDGWDG